MQDSQPVKSKLLPSNAYTKLEPGEVYLCSAWAKTNQREAQRVELKVQWQDAKGAWYGGAPPAGDTVPQDHGGRWVPLQCMFTVPQNVAYAAVAVVTERMRPDEFVYFTRIK